MSIPQLKTPFDATAYLDWEQHQTQRHEFIDGEVFAMSGASDAHVTVTLNLASLLRSHVRGTPCRVYMADMKLRVEAADAFFYPDVFVTCSETDRGLTHYKNAPVMIVEVLSESTAAYDRGRKFAHYRQLSSLLEYVVIDPTRLSIDVFRRIPQGPFMLCPFEAGEQVELTSVGFVIPIEELYEDVIFSSSDLIDPD